METNSLKQTIERAELAPFLTLPNLYPSWLGALRAIFISTLVFSLVYFQAHTEIKIWASVLVIVVGLVLITAVSALSANQKVQVIIVKAPKELRTTLLWGTILPLLALLPYAGTALLIPFPFKWVTPVIVGCLELLLFGFTKQQINSKLKQLNSKTNA